MATTVEGKHFSRRAETQLSLLDAEFPVSFKATEFGSLWATCAIYANGAGPHKHWLFRILLIWRVGT
jgi:hypothetical protein